MITYRHICPNEKRVSKLTWFEQNTFGLVDVQMDCGNGYSHRFTGNNGGSANVAKVCESGFSVIQGMEQIGYGIINSRMTCRGDNQHTDSNANVSGSWNGQLICSDGFVIGMAVREEVGFGIMNFKILCSILPSSRLVCSLIFVSRIHVFSTCSCSVRTFNFKVI